MLDTTALAWTPLALVPLGGTFYVPWLKTRFYGQYIREDGPESHHQKSGTPTMGGLLILLSVLIGLLLIVCMRPIFNVMTLAVLSVLLITLVLAALGFMDDYQKIAKKHNKGVSGYTKLAVQIGLGLLLGMGLMLAHADTQIRLFNGSGLDLGIFYPVLTAFIIAGASNAVNLTDGLDGLASGTLFCTFLAFYVLFQQHFLPDLALLSMLFASAVLGFFWINRYPAKIFMGDVGSLALGGAVGALAIVGKLELWLLLLGALYILEALSVILQVGYFKLTHGKRLFKMAPLHHHFELLGWHESWVVTVFILFQASASVIAVVLYQASFKP